MLINTKRLSKKSQHVFLVTCVIGAFFVGRNSRSYIHSPGKVSINVKPQKLELSEERSQNDQPIEQQPEELTERGSEQPVEVIRELKPIPWEYDGQYKNPCFKNESTTLFCVPWFYLVGGIESGTKLLYRAIMQHPEAVYPGFEEANFFSKRDLSDLENGGIHDYLRLYENASRMIHGNTNSHGDTDEYNNLITGDATPYMNLWWKSSHKDRSGLKAGFSILDYIYHIVPKARIIVIFRDPVERLYAHYCKRSEAGADPGWPSQRHFHERSRRAITTYNKLFRQMTLRDCLYNEEAQKFTNFSLMFGFHYFYWNELTSVFPRSQILALHYKHLFTKETLQRVFTFLGMGNPGPNVWYRIRLLQAAGEGFGPCGDRKIYWRTRVLLRDFYAPYNEMMYDLTQDKDFLYPLNK